MKPPSKILFVSSRLIGRARATGEMARRLMETGHTVVFARPASIRDHVDSLGARSVEIADIKLGGPAALPPSSAFDYLPASRRTRLSRLQRALNLEEIEKVIRDEKPNLVIIDFEMHPHILVACAMNVPVALLTDNFITRPGPQSPPLDTDIVPYPGTAARVRLAWLRSWVKWRRVFVERWIKTAGTDYLSLLRFVAAQRNVPIGKLTTRWWWQVPFAWRGLPLIILQAPSLDFPAPPAQNFHFVGPMLPKPGNMTSDENNIVEIARAARLNGKKVVYIVFGSTFRPKEKVIGHVWAAIGARKDVVAIHSTGRKGADFGIKKPDNVHLVDWAPQDRLLELADVAVIHGGVNTIAECIESGTPMLSIPIGVDQPGCSARLTYHGVGIGCDQAVSAEAVRAELHELLTNRSYADRCLAMRRDFATYRDGQVAEKVVSRLLEATNQGQSPGEEGRNG